MKYQILRSLKFSQITLGTVQLGQNYGIANKTGKPDTKTAFKILTLAIKSGINVFDTAPSYGNSEKILGSFFLSGESSGKAINPIIVTKIPPMQKMENLNFPALYDKMKSIIGQSLENLNLDQIPICLLHDPKDIEKNNQVIVDCLQQLKKEKLVGKIGVSVYTIEDVKEFLKIGTFDAIQIPINIFDHRLIKAGLLEELKRKEIITFARSIFLQGLFFLNLDSIPPYLESARPFLKDLRKLSEESKISIPEIAWRFVRDLPSITSLVLGIETPQQLSENITKVDSPSLNNEITQKIYDLFDEIPESIVNPSKWNK